METNHTLTSHYRLIFNVATPSLEEAWLEGFDACQEEKDNNLNPYTKKSNEYRYWNDGWWTSFYGEEPLFNLSGNPNPRALSQTPSLDRKVKKATWGRHLLSLSCILLVTLASYTVIEISG